MAIFIVVSGPPMPRDGIRADASHKTPAGATLWRGFSRPPNGTASGAALTMSLMQPGNIDYGNRNIAAGWRRFSLDSTRFSKKAGAPLHDPHVGAQNAEQY
jgi:hypothetical protein